jgi:acyl-coenzyme A thioesterase PaaI-like protein
MPGEPHEADSGAAVAGALRRAIRAARVTQVDDAVAAQAASLIEQAATLLEADEFAGPHCQVGFDLAEVGFSADAEPHDYFPMSPVVGPHNPIAPPLRLRIEPDRSVSGTVVLGEAYNGPPWNLAHGGVIALLFDELLGVATIAKHGGGFTARLTVRYRRPTPILEELALRSWVERDDNGRFTARGELAVAATGEVTAEADGLFVQLSRPLRADGP